VIVLIDQVRFLFLTSSRGEEMEIADLLRLGECCLGEPDSEQACGEYSNCMNRMMQIECEAGDCRCGGKCQNQR